jgi:pSer/pThr/pTyr-binding forkhead associated (FHA) protein
MLFTQWQQPLCQAISKRKSVDLRYKNDLQYRRFDPYAVYRSTKDNLCVSGLQTKNNNKPLDPAEPRVFDLSEIKDVRITDASFIPDSRFDRHDPRYKNGIICSV